jgi:hypothetical protein
MYMTLMFLWWLFFVNSEATLWSVSSMRSSKMMKCFSLGSQLSRSGKPCWNYIPSTVPYNVWYSPWHHKIRSGLGVIMCLMLGTNRRTNIDFPLPVGPAIILVNGCTHGMKWSGSYPSGTPPKKTDYWFSKYNRVLLHYSVSIAAAAATAEYIPLSAAAVYIPQSTAAAAAAHTPRSAAFMLFSRNTTVRTQTW